jgi:hypothetical protein
MCEENKTTNETPQAIGSNSIDLLCGKGEYEIYSLQWEYEDQLPEMSDLDFDLIYEQSKVIDFVRMYPYITVYCNKTGISKRIYLGA